MPEPPIYGAGPFVPAAGQTAPEEKATERVATWLTPTEPLRLVEHAENRREPMGWVVRRAVTELLEREE